MKSLPHAEVLNKVQSIEQCTAGGLCKHLNYRVYNGNTVSGDISCACHFLKLTKSASLATTGASGSKLTICDQEERKHHQTEDNMQSHSRYQGNSMNTISLLLLTRMLGDFMSRCNSDGVRECKQSIASHTSRMSETMNLQENYGRSGEKMRFVSDKEKIY